MVEGEKSEVSKREEAILAFWNKEKIFEKSLAKPAPKGEFVFYDGPPFATGLPHHGHLLGSTSKDLFGRYRTMRGYYVRRRWGWDCHGLPIETKVEEKLGIKNKKEIGALGIEKFNETARSMVLEYVSEWKRYIERLGRWVDFDNSYKTMDAPYTESVWWALKNIHEQGKLYEGKKVLMYCPKDETPLAKAEIAMDNTYKDVTDEAVTVKFKVKNPEKHNLPANTYFLAWTTTPWTLPGNVALAVGSELDYGITEENDEHLIRIGKGMKGKDLVGIEYEPLYDVPLMQSDKSYKVYAADFVTTNEGTGIVHTAVIYGEDDFALGKQERLPMVQLLTPGAVFTNDAPALVRGQYYKKANALIIADLESRGLLYKKEQYTHSYPHCHRCGTPLIYNAVSSWFIDIQSVKQKMLSENEKITWVPGHLKEGRFKNIVEGAPDWTISRNRYWASPMPVWKDAAGNLTVIGSLDELKKYTKKSGNRYFVMRHGEADNNVAATWTREIEENSQLTERGKREVRDALTHSNEKPDIIISSPMLRTRATVNLVCEALGYPSDKVIYDERIREWKESVEYSGKPLSEMLQYYEHDYIHSPHRAFNDGENFAAVVKRAGDFIYDLEHRYSNKTILIVSHAGALRGIDFVAGGYTFDRLHMEGPLRVRPHAIIEPVSFVPLPHNADYELDYHLPYIDEVELVNEKGEKLTRIPEVVDSWVEAGAMPFAEYHYPFESKREFEKRSPGDFISEYIAQTRTWFYYLHALGVILFNRRAFKNVVTTGTFLAEDGYKLSKSKKNYTDPYILFERYGADAFRYYVMSSVVMQAEDAVFSDDELKEVHNKVVNMLRNCATFYNIYAHEAPAPSTSSPHVLDRWILTRLRDVVVSTTAALDTFDTVRATRSVRDFIEDLSTWYVRRSRDRMRDGDPAALSTMRHVLREVAKLSAPVMPFIADEIWMGVRTNTDPESVHLAEWPKRTFSFQLSGSSLLKDMEETRKICSLGLEARQQAGIKVRQPLQKLTAEIRKLKAEYLDLIKDEVNVKEVVHGEFALDTTVTPELKREGEERDAMRMVQDLRKQAGLAPKDKAVLVFSPSDSYLKNHFSVLQTVAGISRFEEGDTTYVRKT